MNENEELALTAGLLIGEGCISMSKIKRDSLTNGFQLQPRVFICNTDRKLIDFCQRVIGGRLQTPTRKENNKQLYKLCIQNFKRIITALEKVRPYMIAKEKQADLLIEFCRSRLKTLARRKGRAPAPYSEREIEICRELQLLNKKGYI